jgi:hypothetical protein
MAKITFSNIETSDINTILKLPLADCKNALRQLRERECYPIINRGNLWYDTLLDYQKVELQNWYKAWLDVTETFVVPKKPDWVR